MPRLIRRRPLAERIRAYLDPADFLIWLSEELDSSDWEQWQRDWATPIGVLLNLAFLIARANSGYGRRDSDDVFGDDVGAISWTSWLVSVLWLKLLPLKYDTEQHLPGCLYRTFLISRLLPERLLHILSPAPLPTFREQRGQCPKHTISTSGSSKLLARILLSPTLPLKHHCRREL